MFVALGSQEVFRRLRDPSRNSYHVDCEFGATQTHHSTCDATDRPSYLAVLGAPPEQGPNGIGGILLFWGHTQWFPGIIPGRAWGPYGVLGLEPESASCKASVLAALSSPKHCIFPVSPLPPASPETPGKTEVHQRFAS